MKIRHALTILDMFAMNMKSFMFTFFFFFLTLSTLHRVQEVTRFQRQKMCNFLWITPYIIIFSINCVHRAFTSVL